MLNKNPLDQLSYQSTPNRRKKIASAVAGTVLTIGGAAFVNDGLDDDRVFNQDRGNPAHTTTTTESTPLPSDPVHIVQPGEKPRDIANKITDNPLEAEQLADDILATYGTESPNTGRRYIHPGDAIPLTGDIGQDTVSQQGSQPE